MFKNAHIHYKDIDLKAGFIEINNLTNIITAKGIKDSIGVYSELPVFKQGSQESVQDTIKFNFKSEKAKIWNLKTDQQGIIIKGEVSKKHNDSVVFIENIKLTSSQKDDPDYYIRIKKAKFIKDPSIVSSKLIPPAKKNGNEIIAHHGSPAIVDDPARISSATSVAVSKPNPNKIPSGYIFHEASIRRAIGPKKRISNPRESRCFSNSSSLYAPWRILIKTPTIETKTIKFKIPIIIKKVPLTEIPISPV